MNKLKEKFDKVLPVVDEFRASCGDSIFLDLGQYDSDSARISVFPAKGSEGAAVKIATKYVGVMKKEHGGNMEGKSDLLSIALFSVLKCTIIGTKKVKKPIMQEVGEKEVEEPIYDCKVEW